MPFFSPRVDDDQPPVKLTAIAHITPLTPNICLTLMKLLKLEYNSYARPKPPPGSTYGGPQPAYGFRLE
uniref:Uncharacterized protein n=1 Tax=Salix viminalis TaxID=40686 RepID=A0A6N2NJ02_SALVM